MWSLYNNTLAFRLLASKILRKTTLASLGNISQEPNSKPPFLYEPPKREVRSVEPKKLTAANTNTASIEVALYVVADGDSVDKSARPPLVASLVAVVCLHTQCVSCPASRRLRVCVWRFGIHVNVSRAASRTSRLSIVNFSRVLKATPRGTPGQSRASTARDGLHSMLSAILLKYKNAAKIWRVQTSGARDFEVDWARGSRIQPVWIAHVAFFSRPNRRIQGAP